MFLIPISLGQTIPDHTYAACQNNQNLTLVYNMTWCTDGVCERVEQISNVICPYGCDNSTGGSNDCNVDPDTNLLNTIPTNLFVGLIIVTIGFFIMSAISKMLWLRIMFLFAGLISLVSGSNMLVEASQVYKTMTYTPALLGYYEFAVYFAFAMFAIFFVYLIWDILDLFGKLPQWAVRFKERKSELEKSDEN